MPLDRYLIAPFTENSGLTTNLKPWQIPDEAFATMDNMYVYRGRIRKRFGSRYMGSGFANINVEPLFSRFRIQVGTIGAPVSPIPGTVTAGTIGQSFSAGTQIFTVYQLGTPAAMLATGPGTGTFNTTTGAFALAGTGLAGATPIYFYPTLPVMGLTQYQFSTINNYPTFGFDTQFAYQFTGGAWSRSGTAVWHGDDTDLFWAYNWVGPNTAASALTRALFVSNFHVTNINGAGTANDDPMYYYDGSTWTAYRAYINPNGGAIGTGPFVETALIIVPFHGRLLLFNTIENDGGAALGTNTNYVNRVRYTSVGSPFATSAWYGVGAFDAAGNRGKTAGFEDASTLEAIISVGFTKDKLVVGFEESTWELTYTGNEQKPFEWQRLNSELGSMSTFSLISFDKANLYIGETGVNSCNGSNVLRIDQKIPSQIFEISNPATEVERITGIRDYYTEMVYWSIPVASQRADQKFPTRVLVYNYQNETWAFNDDCITAFGYFDGAPPLTWATLSGTWAEWNGEWASGQGQQQTRQIIAGNQQGFVFIIDTDQAEQSRNEGVLPITQLTSFSMEGGIILKIYNHMLKTGDYILLEGCQGVVLNGNMIYIVVFFDKDTVVATYPESVVEQTGLRPTFTGTYTGGGTAARVSNYDLYSKQWNPYDKDGRNVFVAKIDFSVTRTHDGEVTVDYSPSSSPLSMVEEGTDTSSIMGTSVLETSPYALYPLEATQTRLWHPVYFQTQGECIQINIYMSEVQMCDPSISLDPFEIHGMVLHTSPTSSRLE